MLAHTTRARRVFNAASLQKTYRLGMNLEEQRLLLQPLIVAVSHLPQAS
jgi:hypothetical protein